MTKDSLIENTTVYPHELEQASNSYLMAVISVMAGLPLPIINVVASLGFYLAHRKAGYFVRRHCIQAVLAQTIMMPFNSFAFAWTLKLIIQEKDPDMYYFVYLLGIVIFNIVEFFAVIITASAVRKGKNVRWFLIADITDALCSKENRDPYRI